MNYNTFLILPGCDDRNRGDQALIWETVDLAKQAGYNGKYYMVAGKSEASQSEREGISGIPYILKHPSRFSTKKNISYSISLKVRWGLIALFDIINKEPLLYAWYRKLFLRFYSKETQETIKKFADAKCGFVKGGGFLHATGGLTETYKIYYFLYHIRLMQSFRHNVYVMPNSFGPFNAPFVAKMIKGTLKKCKVVMTRESISNKMLDNIGVTALNTIDLAFFLEGDRDFDPIKELKEKGIDTNRKMVGITVRPYRFLGENNPKMKYENYKQSITIFVEWLSSNGYYPVLIEHVYDSNEHEQDIKCIKEVCTMLKRGTSYSVYTNRELTCRQMKAVYSKMMYTIGTRFHSVIFSMASGVPSIAITYGGNKGQGIMKDMGLLDYSIPISEISGKRLIKCFCKLVKYKDDIKEKLKIDLMSIQEKKQIIVNMIKEEEGKSTTAQGFL